MSKLIFESALEKVGRILASQYHIDVIFEGNQAFTDGKKVVLPYIEEMSDEMRADLNGYLDHEVGHCKFTKFDEMKAIETRFHKELFNAIEDVRIEREMVGEFPGCALNLTPLNTKLRSQIDPKIPSMPWPIRIILAIRDIMEGREPIVDEEIERYVDLIKDASVKLNDCKDTHEVLVKTAEIAKLIKDEREEEKKEEGEGESDEKKDGKGKPGKGKGKAEKGDEDSEGSGGGFGDDDEEGDSESESDGASDSGDSSKSGKAKYDKMLTEKIKDEKKAGGSEFDKHITDVKGMMDKLIDKAIKEEEKKDGGRRPHDRYHRYEKSTRTHIPVTTRYDLVTDHSGKGNPTEYGRAKREVMKHVGTIKSALERVLKVKENAKWRTERDRGTVNARSLSKMTPNPAYREVFKEFSKVETNNVAVELLVDLSGSMSGQKIEVAKQAALAMGEALKALDIAFEVTGFCSEPDRRVSALCASVSDTSRFNRTSERLDLHVFKSFDCANLLGITKLRAGSQNPDGECVAWAAKRLSMTKQKRKILIVFSDGQPCTGDGNGWILAGDLARKVKSISKIGIEVIGIGIESDSVKQFYPDYIVIDRLADLPKAALAKLSKIILKAS